MEIFISYSNFDQHIAMQIRNKLEKRGISSFLAPRDIMAGDPFKDKIREHLQNCQELFLLVTPNSLNSEWVISEWAAAWALEKYIVPILFRCGPEDLPTGLQDRQARDFHEIDKIIEEYEERQKRIGKVTAQRTHTSTTGEDTKNSGHEIIGVDFGTTNSLVARYSSQNRPVLLNVDENSALLPSLFAIHEGRRLVGGEVEVQLQILDDSRFKGNIDIKTINPQNVVFWIKKLLGRSYQEYKSSLEEYPFKIIASPEGDIWIVLEGYKFSPGNIATQILRTVKNVAAAHLEGALSAVVPVPVRFNDRQRRVLELSVKEAGFENVDLGIDEATAAALGWLFETNYNYNGVLAVYDLGGGTFDVSIVEIRNGVINVKAVRGDDSLGGYHFDLNIANYLFLEQVSGKRDFLTLPIENQYTLRRELEKARKKLSMVEQYPILFNSASQEAKGTSYLTRPEIYNATKHLVNRTIELCEEALGAAEKQGVGQIDDVILSGGMTYTPFIRDMVKDFFFGANSAKRPIFPPNPSILVVNGAAIYAGMKMRRVSWTRIGERVAPFSYGITCYRDYPRDKRLFMSVIIERDNKLFDANGTSQSFPGGDYVTVYDNQSGIAGSILQALVPKSETKKLASECTSLGTYEVEIQPYPRGVNGLNITLQIDDNGILELQYYEIKNPRNAGKKRFNMLLHADALTAPASQV